MLLATSGDSPAFRNTFESLFVHVINHIVSTARNSQVHVHRYLLNIHLKFCMGRPKIGSVVEGIIT